MSRTAPGAQVHGQAWQQTPPGGEAATETVPEFRIVMAEALPLFQFGLILSKEFHLYINPSQKSEDLHRHLRPPYLAVGKDPQSS